VTFMPHLSLHSLLFPPYFLFFTTPRPPTSTLFPYTTLFRSRPRLGVLPQHLSRIINRPILIHADQTEQPLNLLTKPVLKPRHLPPVRSVQRGDSVSRKVLHLADKLRRGRLRQNRKLPSLPLGDRHIRVHRSRIQRPEPRVLPRRNQNVLDPQPHLHRSRRLRIILSPLRHDKTGRPANNPRPEPLHDQPVQRRLIQTGNHVNVRFDFADRPPLQINVRG